MGWSTSLIIIAIGAVLRFAITATTSGVNLHTVGLILMILGAVGFVGSLLWFVNALERDRAAGRVSTAHVEYPPDPRF